MTLHRKSFAKNGKPVFTEIGADEEAALRAAFVPDGSSGPLFYNDSGFECVHSDEEAAAIRAAWFPPITKDDLAKRAALRRYEREIAGVYVTVGGEQVLLPTDRGNDREVLTATMVAIMAGLRSDKATFKFADGKSRVVTNAEMTAAIAAAFAHVQGSFDQETELAGQIEAEKIATLDEIDGALK